MCFSNRKSALRAAAMIIMIASLAHPARAGSGAEGASFLDIPVGSIPASLGSAYTSRATDAYAPVWNPAGLAFLDAFKLSGTHLAYLQGIHYEYLGFAVPWKRNGLGASVQYLGSGDIQGANEQGTLTGNFSTTFAAYSLAYGHAFTEQWSIGLTGKAITESIADTSARAYAGDVGTLKFVNESDPLPLAYRMGAFVQILPYLDVSAEAVYRKTGYLSGSAGLQGTYGSILSLRVGLNSAHKDAMPVTSLLTAGIGLHLWGQEFSYAWVPYGDLGAAHYFSLDFRFGGSPEAQKVGLVKVDLDEIPGRTIERPEAAADYQLLDQLLSTTEKKAIDKPNASPPPKESK